METIGVYKGVPLTVDPAAAIAFAAIGWVVVLALVFFTLWRWWRTRAPAEAKKS